MFNHPLAPKNYTIENTWRKKQLVSVGGEDAIVGCQHLIGGTQTWKLMYVGNYATFQGVSPDSTDGKYIGIDWTRNVLVYSKTPGLFLLHSVNLDENIFIIRYANFEEDTQPRIGWQLQNEEDGSPVRIANVMIEGAEWKFS
ncbi:hypothetical protein K503DRAFT_773654 [Rhizopogon vinicolor AM-OR11-026]|uniref:Uncharacterized protein n=1 Tax=Rhizopogon vinicolor AM-OR11-026 TaxID=1314800 RepID=A0A1B7MRQ7_9AGAM|nr:hypothetical protein K503DRAFT_773654 [Rhizopogon vinicolor AM-OR11-026]